MDGVDFFTEFHLRAISIAPLHPRSILFLALQLLTKDAEVCLSSDGLVVVRRPHLALEVGVVGQADVRDLEAELAAAVAAQDAVARKAGDGTVVTCMKETKNCT